MFERYRKHYYNHLYIEIRINHSHSTLPQPGKWLLLDVESLETTVNVLSADGSYKRIDAQAGVTGERAEYGSMESRNLLGIHRKQWIHSYLPLIIE